MSDLDKILFTAFATIVSGSFVFIVGQLVSRFILEPRLNQKRIIGEIIYGIIFYDDAVLSIWDIENPDDLEKIKDARLYIRDKASNLLAVSNSIPLYVVWESFGLVPHSSDIYEVTTSLIQISRLIGQAHFPQDMDLLSELRFKVLKKLDIRYKDLLEEEDEEIFPS